YVSSAIFCPTTSDTFSLHDALPIFVPHRVGVNGRDQRVKLSEPSGCSGRDPRMFAPRVRRQHFFPRQFVPPGSQRWINGECCEIDRKSTRLNSSHVKSSYAVFCLKK